ncbi:RNA polymerase sigma factor RpoD/SigA [Pedobacter sp. ASV1-7]|uniref:sigma-70 family RNA polymerase sigma factor n=1 Tax=Pedobacter sp. ASV1-7 TaxID=3145237 RepID=UPI0032E884BE
MKEINIERSITNRKVDSFERYLYDLGKYPLLAMEEEAILARKIRKGDQAALNKLVNCNLRFVITVAKKYELPGISLPDLVSDGNIGLIKAAKRFDETKGFKFITYAVWWIRQSILYSMGINKRMIRLPGNQLKGILDLRNAEAELEQDLHRFATVEEISEHMNLPCRLVLEYISNTTYAYSYDVPISADEPETKLSIMCDNESVSPDGQFESDTININIGLMMNVLTAREKEILCLAYGIGAVRSFENREIGMMLGISAETVRRVKGHSLEKLKSRKNIAIMKEYA